MKKFAVLTIFVAGVVMASSCLDRQFIEGKVEMVSVSDTLLNDSSLISGQVHHVDADDPEHYYDNEFEIWIENSDWATTTDTTGYYSLKIAPGTYAVKCEATRNHWERLVEETQHIDFAKNTKTTINFYIGYTVE
ncbi:hypothetical protein [Maribellus sp. YY47]|uniref:hypothetical protein n=1 Tax=Maribellus sp. YY47 TaxID=2929486 RepID=UPI0020009F7D|nr:hypothetical protein [Maribellus sp. YY47]MCK3686315.1 hypothetical protein [Maribellus sp. YY47]